MATGWSLPPACPPVLPWSVTHSQLPMRDMSTNPSTFCSSAHSTREQEHSTGPKEPRLQKTLRFQRGPAADSRLHQYHHARCLRTCLEHRRRRRSLPSTACLRCTWHSFLKAKIHWPSSPVHLRQMGQTEVPPKSSQPCTSQHGAFMQN